MSDELIDGRELRSRLPQSMPEESGEPSKHEGGVVLPRAAHPHDEPSHPYVVLEPPEEASEFLDREVGDPTRPSLPTVALDAEEIERAAPAEAPAAPAPESSPEPPPPISVPEPEVDDSHRLMRLPRVKLDAEEEPPTDEQPVPATEEPSTPSVDEGADFVITGPTDPQATPIVEIEPAILEMAGEPAPAEDGEIQFREAMIAPGEDVVTGEFAEAIPDVNLDAVIDGESPETPAAWKPYATPQEPSRLAAIWAVVLKRGLPVAVLVVMASALILVPLVVGRLRRSGGVVPPQATEKPSSTEEGTGGGAVAPTPIPPTSTPVGPTPTPLPPWAQGRIVYASNADGDFDLVRLDLTLGVEKVLTTNDAADRSPAWSPDGHRIVYVSDLFGVDNLFLINADGTNLVQLTSSSALDHSPAWSPDGSSILFSREDVEGSSLIRLDTACIEDDPPQSCEESLTVVTTGSYDLFPEWSPDGGRIAFANSGGPGDPLRIATIAANGSGFTVLPGTSSSDFAPIWSRDGSLLLFVSYLQGDDDLWRMNPDGTNVVQITGNQAIDASPAWSPDGAWIAFASDRGPAGDFDLYVISAECTVADPSCEEAARHITTAPADELDAAWAP